LQAALDGKLNTSGGTLTGYLQMGANRLSFSATDPDICLSNFGGRIAFGRQTARGANVSSLLVSNAWADASKVPANGIYSKGPVHVAGYPVWHSGTFDPASKVGTTGDESISGTKTFTSAIAVTGTGKAAGRFYAGTTEPTNTTRTNYDGHLHAKAFGTGRFQMEYNPDTESLDFNFK
jgi:hypothetical protein